MGNAERTSITFLYQLLTMTPPSVSIVICTCNGAPYIREQLDSILAQTYPIPEIIIQDDQSKDGTKEILE